jgi:hypothetical protein
MHVVKPKKEEFFQAISMARFVNVGLVFSPKFLELPSTIYQFHLASQCKSECTAMEIFSGKLG